MVVRWQRHIPERLCPARQICTHFTLFLILSFLLPSLSSQLNSILTAIDKQYTNTYQDPFFHHSKIQRPKPKTNGNARLSSSAQRDGKEHMGLHSWIPPGFLPNRHRARRIRPLHHLRGPPATHDLHPQADPAQASR